MNITPYDHHPTLRHEERDALGTALQAGPTFRELHLQLDELAETARGLSDDEAERPRALGWSPEGRRQILAQYDAVTEDLLHQAALDLDQHARMFSAHQGH